MKKPIHDDLPTDRAWQEGRRIYVRCGFKSQLNGQLRALGAKWDGDVRALWVGSTKKAPAVELVLAAEARIDEIKRVKAEGRWVRIPYDAAEIRQRAKELEGIWDDDTKSWAMRTDDSLTEIKDLLAQRQARLAAEEAEYQAAVERGRKTRKEAEEAADEARALARRERIIAESGRTPTGEVTKMLEIATRFMNKHQAHESAVADGTLVELGKGRRGIVVGVEIWFTGSEMASSVCWHAETHDEAHWDFRYTVVVVESTDEERAADAEREAVQRDTRKIHDLMERADKLVQPLTPEEWAALPKDRLVGKIQNSYGTATYIRGGTLTLYAGGRVEWHHPGYYDDYIATGGITTDPDVAAEVRAVLDLGDRTRVIHDQMAYTYEVKIHRE